MNMGISITRNSEGQAIQEVTLSLNDEIQEFFVHDRVNSFMNKHTLVRIISHRT